MIVAAVSSKVSKKPNQPTHVLVDKNPAFRCPSIVLLEQISTIDKKRICNFMGMTTDQEMSGLWQCIRMMPSPKKTGCSGRCSGKKEWTDE